MAEKAFLIGVGIKGDSPYLLEESLEELSELTRSAGGSVQAVSKSWVERPSPATYVGSGKVQELRGKITAARPDLVIMNQDLSPVQARNLEDAFGRRIVDRTGLILDIFARRAKSHEGRLQVELAQLLYLLPRLTGRGVLLSRLGGGIGTRGPGEKKLEYDRRRIRERVSRLKKEIEKIRTHRVLIRKGRRRKDFTTVAIVGYTNAGKSTLLNALTGAGVLAEDKLFATLDPTTRLYEDGRVQILFTDTVGFIINLPPNLIEAFQATLEEIKDAEALLHVLDAAHPQARQQEKTVREILKKIGVTGKPVVLALNKVDLLKSEDEKRRWLEDYPAAVFVSAKEKTGFAELIAEIARRVRKEPRDGEN